MSLRFSYCAGNRFELLIDGEQVGPAILEAFAQARREILIELYLIESGGFATAVLDALRLAADRGVAVCLMFDHFGSLGLSSVECERLRHSNIQLIWHNPIRVGKWLRNFHRDHRKIIVVDQQLVFVGGFCITDEFWQGPGQIKQSPEPDQIRQRPWLDVAVRIQGPIVQHWRELFARVWSRATETPLVQPFIPPLKAGEMIGRVAWASGHLYQGILREFIARAKKAENHIYIATPYFVPSWRIRKVLIKAAKRGVDVRLLLPGPETDHPGVRFAAWRYYKKMLRHGIHIHEYQPRFVHAKVILCDKWASIGSCNLDHWNQRWNLEANQEVRDEAFADDVLAFFRAGFEESEEQDLKEWLRPYWRRRFLAYLWGRVDSWLMRL